MNAEDMRTELESFLNEGLDKGWCGWPTKRGSAEPTEQNTDRSAVSLAVPLIGGDGHSVLSLWRSLPWLLRSPGDSGSAYTLDIRPMSTPLPGDWAGKRLFSREC